MDDIHVGHDEAGHGRRQDGDGAASLQHFGGRGGVDGRNRRDGAVGSIAHVVELGYVHAGNCGQARPKRVARGSMPATRSRLGKRRVIDGWVVGAPAIVGGDYIEDDLFAFTDDHRIKEGAHGFRVVAARTARKHQWVGDVTLGSRAAVVPATSSMVSTLV